MISGKEFKELRKAKGLTLKDVAKVLHTSEQAVNKYELEIVRNIPLDRIEKMAKLYEVSPAYIMGWDEKPKNKPPVYEAAAGEGVITDGYPSEEYPIRLEQDQIIVRVRGHSMEPTLHDGDLVVVTATSEISSQRQIALVKINGDEATLKRVKINPDGILLIGDNVDVYPPRPYSAAEVMELPIEIRGVVTTLIRDME